MTESVRLLIADDHEIVRRGLRATLESRPGWTVCGEAVNGREAVRMAATLRPDIVIMDLTMPEMNGLEATRLIRKQLPQVEVLILTMHESEQLFHEVLAAGARSYILKSDAGNAIFQAVESLRHHRPFFTSRVSEALLHSYLDPSSDHELGALSPSEVLTPRERQIVQLIAEGKSTKEVAIALRISVKTAETHRTNLMRKLDIHSVSEIVRYAIRNQIVQP
jgi:DNA-binding NarL/FixJ family response regulator